ncbi:wall-associated receptor kinase-like 1 [Bidens hawaiensis]|uniref:wall-associated receptor kinase-like 1 n=1 Tax=Bidens hawaiensis TaxID=980011 RepID=UPI00404A4822
MKLFKAYHFLIFLSITSTYVASQKFTKTGCNDTCGNVMIPYPFGIGADCSVNQWYNVDCNSSRPSLPALNHLEVLSVNLVNQTVTVSTPRITDSIRPCTDCKNNSSEIMGVDLSGRPFLFSKQDNTFVYEGCGTATLMDNGSVLTGCSTACGLNVTVLEESNTCFGNRCCQTAVPHCLKSYNINLTSFERKGEGEACGYAFLVDKTSYNQGRSSDPIIFRNSSFIPVSLLWILTSLDSFTCCNEVTPEEGTLDIYNGTPVDTRNCGQYHHATENPYLKDGCYSYETPKYAKTGGNDTCGSVSIPYPFGIGANCSLNQWYTVDCNSSKPYLPALNHLELLGVSLKNQTVTVSSLEITNCQNPVLNSSEIMGVDLVRSPFLFSREQNIFVFDGCGMATVMENDRVLTACYAACHGVTLRDRNNCFGVGCCENVVPNFLNSYNIHLTGLVDEGGACWSAFMVDEASYDPSIIPRNTSFVPISLTWVLMDSDWDQLTCCYDESRVIYSLDMLNGTTVDTWKYDYNSRSLEGSIYLIDGCSEVQPADPTDDLCTKCKQSGGRCKWEAKYDGGNGHLRQNLTCIPKGEGTSLGVILGVSISMGVLFLVASSYFLYRVIKKTKERRRRKRFFKRNGGLLLKQQEEVDPSLADKSHKTILFTSRELEKATDNFNENRILGRGGQGTVYKGMLVDGRIVAVKKSKTVDENQLEQFINEVVILSQVNHRNVVKLLGCCLETEVPLLVSEYIPNGTLYDRLHKETNEFPISLNMRLQIATEVAGALAYLHSATSIPIYHRDIKTNNILLDDKYRAKVSDFGTSRLVTVEQTHFTTLVKGTFGYLDPEYYRSSQFTEKSDVYSFGVVLVELLTGEKPISKTRVGESRSLVTHFMSAMEEGRVMSIFDAIVIKEGTTDELLSLANLAMRCLNMKGMHRPTMKEVFIELETIRMSHIPSTIQTKISPTVYGEELSMKTYGETSSTFPSFDGISH